MLDYIIVGQGLAGSVLAFNLQKLGKKFLVLDNEHKHAASKVAAGLVNPITGRRFVKSWMIESLLPEATRLYKEFEQFLDISLLRTSSVFRALTTIKEENDWSARYLQDGYEPFMSTANRLMDLDKLINDGHVYGEIRQSFQVDLPLLLQSYHDYLEQEDGIKNENFDFDELTISAESINYKGLNARRIIFSEGYKVIENPFFNYLPFQPVKGEAFRFGLDTSSVDRIIKHKRYIVPVAEDVYWSGGGYDWTELNETPTRAFRKAWIQDMTNILRIPLHIINHQAGVRPSVKGRKPLLGKHPKFSNLLIFNGLGTKGTSLAPYFAKEMIQMMENNRPINPEVNISRFEYMYKGV